MEISWQKLHSGLEIERTAEYISNDESLKVKKMRLEPKILTCQLSVSAFERSKESRLKPAKTRNRTMDQILAGFLLFT